MKRRPTKKNRWEDHYTRQARKDKYPARSVYKLQEIQQKFRLIRKGHRVLDLGCAPGSWLLYAAELTGPGGSVLGVDIKPVTVRLPGQARAVTGDIADPESFDATDLEGAIDVVLSDMAPATTGRKEVDAARSLDLCRAALAIAIRVLKPGGAFLCKIFTGEETGDFASEVETAFRSSRIFKPQSSRKASKEIFVIGTGRK